MQRNKYFPMALFAAAVLSGCAAATVPQNPSLATAHSSYDSARSNPQVVDLAALELKEAGDSLSKADNALSKGQGTATVDHLAYLASQQVAIAQETARRKTAELAVTNAGSKRDQIRLEARTAEADVARQETNVARQDANIARQEADMANQQTAIANQQVVMVAELANQQAADLAVADANSQRDQELIAKQEMQLKELNAKKTERGMVITLGDVLFRTDKAQLESGGIHNVQKLADFLKQYPQHKVLIEGHTDSTGSSNHNLELSERRANAVQMALIEMGISRERIGTRGYGEAFPVASNDTAASRLLNRRVEIILSDASGKIAPR